MSGDPPADSETIVVEGVSMIVVDNDDEEFNLGSSGVAKPKPEKIVKENQTKEEKSPKLELAPQNGKSVKSDVSPANTTEGVHNLWVKNLSSDVTAVALKQLFREHGNVVSAKIITSSDDNGDVRCGLVQLASSADLVRCRRQLDQTEFHGQRLAVDCSPTQPELVHLTRLSAKKAEPVAKSGLVDKPEKIDQSGDAEKVETKEESVLKVEGTGKKDAPGTPERLKTRWRLMERFREEKLRKTNFADWRKQKILEAIQRFRRVHPNRPVQPATTDQQDSRSSPQPAPAARPTTTASHTQNYEEWRERRRAMGGNAPQKYIPSSAPLQSRQVRYKEVTSDRVGGDYHDARPSYYTEGGRIRRSQEKLHSFSRGYKEGEQRYAERRRHEDDVLRSSRHNTRFGRGEEHWSERPKSHHPQEEYHWPRPVSKETEPPLYRPLAERRYIEEQQRMRSRYHLGIPRYEERRPVYLVEGRYRYSRPLEKFRPMEAPSYKRPVPDYDYRHGEPSHTPRSRLDKGYYEQRDTKDRHSRHHADETSGGKRDLPLAYSRRSGENHSRHAELHESNHHHSGYESHKSARKHVRSASKDESAGRDGDVDAKSSDRSSSRMRSGTVGKKRRPSLSTRDDDDDSDDTRPSKVIRRSISSSEQHKSETTTASEDERRYKKKDNHISRSHHKVSRTHRTSTRDHHDVVVTRSGSGGETKKKKSKREHKKSNHDHYHGDDGGRQPIKRR